MLLKIEKKGGGLPLLAAALSACPADCHPGLDPGSPFLLASKTSSSTPSNGRSIAAPVTPGLRAF